MDDSYNLLSYLPGFELEFLDKLRKNLPQDYSGTINLMWFLYKYSEKRQHNHFHNISLSNQKEY